MKRLTDVGEAKEESNRPKIGTAAFGKATVAAIIPDTRTSISLCCLPQYFVRFQSPPTSFFLLFQIEGHESRVLHAGPVFVFGATKRHRRQNYDTDVLSVLSEALRQRLNLSQVKKKSLVDSPAVGSNPV
ncbi:hypothetical protein EVAR_49477_1 [Eumeta japonica]|uniref:Uncharacterized protein n=1 Tax=Eumeta variegata TaxID=151549 RepID=A0A4C1VXL8_EUMVA|nr:hypothetical protein EVAR_49477_1 [Eumeta japonica]